MHDYYETVAITGQIFSDDSGLPDAIYSVGATGTINDISDTGVINEILFESAIELPAGTYHAVLLAPAGSVWVMFDSGGSGSTNDFTYNGPPWEDATQFSHYYAIGVLGCE
jgi:hypothetical protein